PSFRRPEDWFRTAGYRPTQVVGPVQRFQCRICGKGFSSRTFDIDYWTHRTLDYTLITNLLVGGSGLRQSSRTLGVSTQLLANRHSRLARQALAVHCELCEEWKLREPLVLDGFQSFAHSQYYPNNINLLVGAQSQFVVGMNATVLRRSGQMTEAQKRKRERLETVYRAPHDGVFRSSRQLLELGCDLALASGHLPIEIRSDEKREYQRALTSLKPYGDWKEVGLVVHQTVSSKRARTVQNPLFAVNYLDRQLRKDLADHVRETVRFARRLPQSLERVMVHLWHHNFFKTYRTRQPDPEVTHAETAGIERGRIQDLRRRSLRDRALGWRYRLDDWQRALWTRSISIPIHQTTALARHLLTA
ncbi:hypothetical protein, partial [Leptospira levettii]|uniref:hypothetical protein n=1 Tax=Leptospira levettii TaxID=2023178 RepID=UPI001AEF3F36